MRKQDRFFFLAGILMLASEIWKQICLTFVVNHHSYSWWHFPFQLCSIPMYLCLILPWIRLPKLRSACLAFLMDFGLLGGIFAFFDTSGMHYSWMPLTLHSFLWHIVLILLGVRAGLYSRPYSSWKTYGYCVWLYLACCLTATILNTCFYPLGTINLFYISPYYPMTQRVFGDIADIVGNTAGILIYVGATIAGAGLFHKIWRILPERLSHFYR
jgi:hypothetical protein